MSSCVAESEVDITGVVAAEEEDAKLMRMVGIYSVASVPRRKSCFSVR